MATKNKTAKKTAPPKKRGRGQPPHAPDDRSRALVEIGKFAGISDKLIALSDAERELKEAFNRDVGNVRLILVLSPT